MGKNKYLALYHTFFWAFVYSWEFMCFYDVEKLSASKAGYFATFQTLLYVAFVYINLFFLIPKLLKEHGILSYVTGVVIVCAMFFLIASNSPLFSVIDLNDSSNYRIVLDLYFFITDYFIFLFVSSLYWYFSQHRREKEKGLQLQNEKLQAELQLLKSQISPHFLFNSLNNIYSLSVLKDENASVMIEKLSDILRYVIYEGKKEKVSLEREVLLIKNYIRLQFLRKLKNEKSIRYQISGDFSNREIAPLLLINIIENCFKHSNVETNSNGFLDIDISIEESQLIVHTRNTFSQKQKKKGIGIQNLIGQLKHHYPNTHTLEFDTKNGIFDIKLSIEMNPYRLINV
jgi:LytS/YehU family sensor histidine kinase